MKKYLKELGGVIMILFSKMQGTGNDFIVVNCLNQYFNYNLGNLANFLCNRNFGVGADRSYLLI